MVKERYEEENESNERKDTGKDKQETHGQEEERSPQDKDCGRYETLLAEYPQRISR